MANPFEMGGDITVGCIDMLGKDLPHLMQMAKCGRIMHLQVGKDVSEQRCKLETHPAMLQLVIFGIGKAGFIHQLLFMFQMSIPERESFFDKGIDGLKTGAALKAFNKGIEQSGELVMLLIHTGDSQRDVGEIYGHQCLQLPVAGKKLMAVAFLAPYLTPYVVLRMAARILGVRTPKNVIQAASQNRRSRPKAMQFERSR
jgi:hypothetical protein